MHKGLRFASTKYPYLVRTRTELPSCEAIDVRKVNIGSIVRPVTKFKAGKNLKRQTEYKTGTNFLAGTNFRDGLIFEAVLTSKIVPTTKMVPT